MDNFEPVVVAGFVVQGGTASLLNTLTVELNLQLEQFTCIFISRRTVPMVVVDIKGISTGGDASQSNKLA